MGILFFCSVEFFGGSGSFCGSGLELLVEIVLEEGLFDV